MASCVVYNMFAVTPVVWTVTQAPIDTLTLTL